MRKLIWAAIVFELFASALTAVLIFTSSSNMPPSPELYGGPHTFQSDVDRTGARLEEAAARVRWSILTLSLLAIGVQIVFLLATRTTRDPGNGGNIKVGEAASGTL